MYYCETAQRIKADDYVFEFVDKSSLITSLCQDVYKMNRFI